VALPTLQRMTVRPCIQCGVLINRGSRCTNCQPARARNGWAWTNTKTQAKQRDDHRCTHHQDGRRCPITKDLTVEHILPIHQGGTDSLNNLTVRCPNHRLDVNQFR
jgi:5-methylcytosine-specific restriction endonuclease McrA